MVTGISGFLGWHVAGFRQRSWRIVGLYNKTAYSSGRHPSYRMDFQDTDDYFDLLEHIDPDAIMHLAAISSPAQCDLEIDQSYRTNVVIPTLTAEFAQAKKVPFLFCSTDMVFSGKAAPYSPSDHTLPLSVYGKEKAEAEKRILELYPQATIVRLPLLFGLSPSGNNFCQQWLNRLTNGQPVHAFTDEYRSTISGSDAAAGLFLLLNQRVPHIWHLGGKKTWSRYQFGCQLAKSFGYSTDLIIPTSIKETDLAGKRAPDLTLNSQMSYEIGFDPYPVEESLEMLKKMVY